MTLSDFEKLRTALIGIADQIEKDSAHLEGLERLALSLGASSNEIDAAKEWALENPEIRNRKQQEYRYLRQQLETLCTLVLAQDPIQNPEPLPKPN